MNTFLSIICSLLLTLQVNTVPARASQQSKRDIPEQTLVGACKQPCLEDGTPVKLRIAQTVSSSDAHVNDRVEFEVLEEIKVTDVLVIPKGGIAWGTVTEAQPKRRMARGGKLEIVMDSVRLVDGEKAALRATQEAQGSGHVGAMTAGIVATGLLFFPAAPFFLFMHGKDISIAKGTEVPTFVNGNFQLDLSKFQSAASAGAQSQPATISSDTGAQINVTSNPPGADIQLDGTFVGNTPSTIGVSPGDHTIDLSKSTYKTWERKIKVTNGKIDIAADLESTAAANPLVEQGKARFNAYKCYDCHGANGEGTDIAPDLVGTRLTADEISKFLQNPSADARGRGMPDIPATSPDLQALVAYVISLKRSSGP